MSLWMLGLETSGAAASVALMRDGALKAEYALNNTRTHSETIMPLAERLMADLSLAPGDLGAIAVDVGPGSFTGVRIGVCAANAMAQALGIPVVGVDALRVLYEGVRVSSRPVCALLDARNENIYAALYGERGACLRPPAAATLSGWSEGLPPDTLFVGDGALAYREALLRALPGAAIAPEGFCFARAGLLLAAAWAAYRERGAEGFQGDAAPLYLRASQAERLWAERRGEGV